MYAIYGNIYHQYTPVMLASIYTSTMDPMGSKLWNCHLTFWGRISVHLIHPMVGPPAMDPRHFGCP